MEFIVRFLMNFSVECGGCTFRRIPSKVVKDDFVAIFSSDVCLPSIFGSLRNAPDEYFVRTSYLQEDTNNSIFLCIG